MRRYIALALSAVLLASCDRAQHEAIDHARGDQAAVAALLRDPASAQWGSVWRAGGSTCGWVNGKNGYGGYVGTRRFYVTGAAHIAGGDLDDKTFDALWTAVCGTADVVVHKGFEVVPVVADPDANAVVQSAALIKAVDKTFPAAK